MQNSQFFLAAFVSKRDLLLVRTMKLAKLNSFWLVFFYESEFYILKTLQYVNECV